MTASKPVTRRQSRSVEKRAQILRVAADYFLAHGFEGTSISEMARASGVSKESIYRYFRSKTELFEEAIGVELADYKERMSTISGNEESSLQEQLLDTASALLGVLVNVRTLALRRLVFQQAASQPAIGQHYFDVGPAQAYKSLGKLFRTHPSVTGVSAKRLSRYFVALVVQPVLLELQCGKLKEPSARTMDRIAKQVVDDFVAGYYPG